MTSILLAVIWRYGQQHGVADGTEESTTNTEQTTTVDADELIAEAEREVSRILAKLEADTGMLLEQLEIRDYDVTTIGDKRQQLLRRVKVQMKRLPGTRWAP